MCGLRGRSRLRLPLNFPPHNIYNITMSSIVPQQLTTLGPSGQISTCVVPSHIATSTQQHPLTTLLQQLPSVSTHTPFIAHTVTNTSAVAPALAPQTTAQSSVLTTTSTIPAPIPVQTVVAPPTSNIVFRQAEPLKPYNGTGSVKQYKEYFLRLSLCNGWDTKAEQARHLLVGMEGAAAEAVRGISGENDTDLDKIWECLKRRFGFVDEPERAMRRFDSRKQMAHETVAMFDQALRSLHQEAWPASNMSTPDVDSRLQRKFVDGIIDADLQQYLR